jgi:hypothetical protein
VRQTVELSSFPTYGWGRTSVEPLTFENDVVDFREELTRYLVRVSLRVSCEFLTSLAGVAPSNLDRERHLLRVLCDNSRVDGSYHPTDS